MKTYGRMAETRKVAAANRHAMEKDHRHRVLEHGEGERAEEDHADEQEPADDFAVRQQHAKLLRDGLGIPGHDELEVLRQGRQEAVCESMKCDSAMTTSTSIGTSDSKA